MTTKALRILDNYISTTGQYPHPQVLVVQKIAHTIDEAKELVEEHRKRGTPTPRTIDAFKQGMTQQGPGQPIPESYKETPKVISGIYVPNHPVAVDLSQPVQHNLLDKVLLGLVRAFIYIAFVFATLADFSLNALLYSLFGPVIGKEGFYQVATATWGVVITGAKLWAWSQEKIALGVFCAIFSMLGVIGVFNSAMEIQAKTAALVNAQVVKNQNVLDPLAQLQVQIEIVASSVKQEEAKIVTDNRDKKEDWIISNDQAYLYKDKERLSKLTDQLTGLQIEPKKETKTEIVVENKLVLDIYNIFGQVAVQIGADRAKFSFWFIVGMAFLVELIIYSTTPRAITKKRRTIKEVLLSMKKSKKKK